jgi:hypothetical protein
VKAKQKALIVTDGVESTHNMAERIAAELTAAGLHVSVLPASGFSATDILPADLCFFGCERPHPPSFAPLEELLRHINLAGRPCGIFSHESREAAGYLSQMTRDSELALNPEPLFGASDLKQWLAKFTGIRGNNGS